MSECRLDSLQESGKIMEAVEGCARANSLKAWITGSGWDLHLFAESGPTKAMLDRAVPDRPAFFEAADGHSAWVNSKALEVAGITAETADPPNGRIERDPSTGEPSGTLRERAMALVSAHVPKPTPQERLDGLRRTLAVANSYGITALLDASASPEILLTYAKAEKAGLLTARITASQRYRNGGDLSEQIAAFQAARERWNSPLFNCNQVKLFVDGVMESRTAALLEPYDGTLERGELNYTREELIRIVTGLDQAGLQLQFHAIGDRAVRVALDALEAARRANGQRDARHHIAHLELIAPADIPRLAELGVTANFQTLWAYPDGDVEKLTLPFLGPSRSRWLYPIRSVASTGARIVGGSDWSVTSMNPFEAMQVAITRRALDSTGDVLNREETVDLCLMIAAYTINGAWLRHQEGLTGSLERGKSADLIVLDRDLFATPVSEIHRAKVERTFLAGREVYETHSATAGAAARATRPESR
jgi:predicted amidohydrolase YtcJ